MKSKLFIVLVIAACLCLSACTERSANSSQSSENTPSSIISDSQEQSEQNQEPQPPAENPSAEEQAPESNSSQQEEENQTPKFVKIEVGVEKDDGWGVFALDSNGNLYFGAKNGSLELVDTDVKDFSSPDYYSFYVLKENGDIMTPQEECYKRDQPLKQLYHNDDAQKVFHSILMLSNGSLISYKFENDSWNPIDIHAAHVDADYFGAGIIDTEGTLWHLNRGTGELNRIAENVIACSYASRNKHYYSDDIWYITADHTMHIFQISPQLPFNCDFPKGVIAVSGSMGEYLAKKESGNVVSNTLTAVVSGSLTANDTGISGQYIDVNQELYAILDENGAIHFGEIQLDASLKERMVFTHPGAL